ncbi:MAG: hypothetical protein FD167_654 [bacterium]|nr:MAG: hypothetical protein FD167_654 [bacterium]
MSLTNLIGKIDITLKFSQMPKEIIDYSPDKEFVLNADGSEVTVRLHSKIFHRLEHANNVYPSWVCLLEGKMGVATEKGFVLDEPKIQVFEKKPKVVEENQTEVVQEKT